MIIQAFINPRFLAVNEVLGLFKACKIAPFSYNWSGSIKRQEGLYDNVKRV
jgi:hypothetical protein